MKRLLRHPITSIREPFGTAGLIVAMIALVAALGGTAFAAAKLNSTQKKEVEKIAKKFAGKPGANGTNGSNGAAGTKGDAGSNGSNGSNGVSAEAIHINGPAHCAQGGVEVKSAAAPAYVCNGQTGFTETLPSGKTETGSWAFGKFEAGSTGPFVKVPISFNIPLAASLVGSGCAVLEAGQPLKGTCQVHYINAAGMEVVQNEETFGTEEITPTGCGAGNAAAPTAEAGNLCLYTVHEENTSARSGRIASTGTGEAGAGTTGAFVNFSNGGGAEAFGTWAVTAE